MTKKSDIIARNDKFNTFTYIGRTKGYNLRAYKYRGKVYVDVTPLHMDSGKGYESADTLRLSQEGLGKLVLNEL